MKKYLFITSDNLLQRLLSRANSSMRHSSGNRKNPAVCHGSISDSAPKTNHRSRTATVKAEDKPRKSPQPKPGKITLSP